MNTLRKLRSPWVIVTLLLATYVTSYFAASDFTPGGTYSHGPGMIYTQYPARTLERGWMVDFYRPMICAESKVRGGQFAAWSEDPQSLWGPPKDWWDRTPSPGRITRVRC